MPLTLSECDKISIGFLKKYGIQVSNDNIGHVNNAIFKAEINYDKSSNLTEEQFREVVCRNACFLLYKKYKSRKEKRIRGNEVLSDTRHFSSNDPVENAIAREVYQEMKSLKPKCFHIIHMRIFDAMSFREIADVYGCAETTITEVYYKGVDRLRKRFNKC